MSNPINELNMIALRNEQALKTWTEKLLKAPMYEMSWGTGAVDVACQATIFRAWAKALKDGTTVEKAVECLRSQVMDRARNVEHGSNAMSNLTYQYETKAMYKALELLERHVEVK